MTEKLGHTCGRAIAPAGMAAAADEAALVSPPSPADLDLRELACPEPMVRALAAADALSPGASLTVITPLLPTPLLEMLASRGFEAGAQRLPDASARVTIRRPLPGERAADADDDGQARP